MRKNISSVNIKAGILNTIAKSIYSDIYIKTREAVSNSIDNKATIFIITVDEHTKSISFYDNGSGISSKRFEEIFNNIGYGQSRNDISTSSYFGLGLMSVLQLGKKAIIYSKCKENKDINHYIIDTKNIFSDDFENQSVDNIKKYITMEILEGPREEKSFLQDTTILDYYDDILPDSFTEIILHNVEINIMNIITSEDFIKKLRKRLPLKINYDDSFFSHIQDKTKLEEIKKKIFNSTKYCKTISVYYGKLESEEGYRELNKYYPDFINDIIFTDADIHIYESKNKSFAAYFLISSQDIEKSTDEIHKDEQQNETGFWVRNRNYLVKSADFFQKPGSRKKIVDAPLTTWIFGEIFHSDMTKMLVVTRDEYIWEDEGFKDFHDELKDFISPINEEYREIWKRGKRIVEAIVEPFNYIRKKHIFEEFDKVLIDSQIISDVSKSEEFLNEISKEFKNPNIEDKTSIVGELLVNNKTDLILADNVEGNIKVVISKQKLLKNYIKVRDPDTQGIIIKISPDVLLSFRTTFMGKNFMVHYVLKCQEKADLSINIDSEEIYINIASQDLAKYSLTFVEFIMFTKVAYMRSKDREQMYRILLDLIGNRSYIFSIQPGNIFSALEDILSRR